MSRRRVLITGITGQDGYYLARALADDEVVGLVRTARPVADVPGASSLVVGALEDPAALRAAVDEVCPDELYHLAAPTFVPDSWRDPAQSLAVIAGATGVLLAAVRDAASECRVVIASSSEVFGDAGESPMRESTPMRPRSPYGVAKLAALGLVRTLRSRGVHASGAITFNHESPRRPERFLPRKVARGAAAIAAGRAEDLTLGDLSAVRDWSDARDIVRGLVLMARADQPGDYVLASGVGRTVDELVDAAFARAEVSRDGRVHVDPKFVRGPEPHPLIGDPSLARERLGWRTEIGFEQTIAEMVDADLAELRGGGVSA